MNKTYKIIWSNTAQEDLNKIIEYIAQDNLDNAINIFNKIKEQSSKLSIYPNRTRIVPELKEFGISLYRELIVDSWRIIYRISDKNIFILSVIDSRQNIEDILLKRFTT